MENLTEKVYECTLAVEAHMICDLLSQAGISARVDGAFLSGAGGELPLGNTVKVRVAPGQAAEARAVIAEWEKQQTGDALPPVTAQPRVKALAWFAVGALVGGAFAFVMINMTRRDDNIVNSNGVDNNGDGRIDVVYTSVGSVLSQTTFDRNFDGAYDARWTFDARGAGKHFEADNNFDGRFEWQADVEYGQVSRDVLDADGDGRPEQVWHFEHGVISQVDYYFASGGRVVKREFFKAGLLDAVEYDDDGDGVFERRVQFDSHAEPKL
jgi:hypothetical protein